MRSTLQKSIRIRQVLRSKGFISPKNPRGKKGPLFSVQAGCDLCPNKFSCIFEQHSSPYIVMSSTTGPGAWVNFTKEACTGCLLQSQASWNSILSLATICVSMIWVRGLMELHGYFLWMDWQKLGLIFCIATSFCPRQSNVWSLSF